MASGNFLTVKTHLSEFKGNVDKDTLSEASESGTSNSVTSEDLQKLAVILGLNSAEDVFQERFRVDRRRLEAMLAENLEDSQTAQAFFNRVMLETNTLINWPARLKIGARSKKDPHVRVAGRPDDVKLAREKIMQLLDTRSNRVTMKIDVSYTDHSHIIGKGGLTIKRVMEETGCHIHFPDSNRTSALEKSNQVSVAGDMERVERARARVRGGLTIKRVMEETGCHIHFPDSNRTSAVEKSNQVSMAGDMERVERTRARVRALTPLIFCFELPIVAASQPLPDINSPYVQHIQDQYNVQVMLRNRPKLHANLLVVKGVQWEVKATMEATSLLMNYMCGPIASQTKVQMTLEISPMHHSIVVGNGAEQLKMIMKGTNSQIMFPDADDPNIPVIRKSCVTITGQLQDVYAARQQLVGSLPLVVIFDVSEDACRIENDTAAKLMHKHNVYINIRRKPKQGIASVVIKGIERCAGDIYEARRELLGGKESVIVPEIPDSYKIPIIPGASMPQFGAFNPFSPSHGNNVTNSPCSPFMSDMSAQYGSPMFGQTNHGQGGYPIALSPVAVGPVYNSWLVPSPQPRNAPFHFPAPLVFQDAWSPMSGGADIAQQIMMQQQQYQHLPAEPRHNTLSQILNSSSQASSGYQSNFTGSSVSLDTQNISGGEGSSNVASSPSVSPISKSHASPTHSDGKDRSQQEIASIIQEMPISERRAPGCEKKVLETLRQSPLKLSPMADYTQKKAEASKAMREGVGERFRVPNSRWSGYYFSHTSPGPININEGITTPEKGWNRSELVRPNIVQSACTPPQPSPAQSASPLTSPCRYRQLYALMQDRGLAKYIELFKKHEVDLSTFASLNEEDLTEIGITAFGARRKMLLIIAELQKQAKSYKGAERIQPLSKTPSPYNTAALSQDKW